MAYVDALPDNGTDTPSVNTPLDIQTVPPGVAEAPTRIVAKDIKLDVAISNPDSSDADVLDAALLKGGVHYPSSANLNENGTVLLFGHSSYLPIVHNQNYKAFDGIQNLKTGEIISVFSATKEYRYAVTEVRVANAEEDVVELPSDKQYLTLITCDSFATKSDRYVVTAVLAQ